MSESASKQNDLTYERHYDDPAGNPAGGVTMGTGFIISWQDGPLRVDGVERPQNGAFVESVIKAVIGRIEYYQGSRFHCIENELALKHLKTALLALNARTSRRQERGVEGTHVV